MAFTLPPIPVKIDSHLVLKQWLHEVTKKLETFIDDVTAASGVTIADESSDTTCFVLFTLSATGDLAVKSGTNITFNSSSGLLTVTAINDSAIAQSGVTQHEAAIDHDALTNFASGEHFLQSAIAITSSQMTGGNHKIFYTNGSGVIVELGHGTSGQVLTSNGATSAPSWQTP